MNTGGANLPQLDRRASEPVVVIHGFGAIPCVMWPLGSRLARRGYNVHYFNYPSLFRSIETHANRLRDFLQVFVRTEGRAHILAHSMGSIVTRAALAGSSSIDVGNILLLAPPNQGTPIARFASYLLGNWLKPTQELSDGPGSYVNSLPPPQLRTVGIIAARFDGLVPLKYTHLNASCQHMVLNQTHSSLLLSRKVVGMADNFFQTGVLH